MIRELLGFDYRPKSQKVVPREALGLLWEHFVAKMTPKMAKRSPKRRKDGQLGARRCQLWATRSAKKSQDGAQEASTCSQDDDTESFWDPLSMIWGALW